MWIEREISSKLQNLVRHFPALVVTGPRQVGKTSLLRRLFPDYHYVSLDLRALAEQAENAPESFLHDHPRPLLIDEVQYAPNLFRHLKVVIDEHRDQRGQFILTGSQKFSLMKEVSDSLAGRCVLVNLAGLTLSEIRSSGWEAATTADQYQALVRGAFPELWADRDIPEREYFQSYISTFLERDLRQILAVGSLRDFERFMRAAAARAGQLLNKSDLARDVGISPTTAGEWISALQAGNQITLLEPFFANITKRLVKSPKLYFNDTGLLSFFLGLSSDSLSNSTLVGAVWENFIFGELLKWRDLYQPQWSLWFYRDQQNREADFIIQGPHDQLTILDAKWSESPPTRSFASLEEIGQLLMTAPDIATMHTALVTRTKSTTQLSDVRTLVSGFDMNRFLEKRAGN